MSDLAQHPAIFEKNFYIKWLVGIVYQRGINGPPGMHNRYWREDAMIYYINDLSVLAATQVGCLFASRGMAGNSLLRAEY